MATSQEQSKLNASLRQAARVGDTGWARDLLKSGAEIDSGDKGTALYIAAKNGRLDICNLLLGHEADVNGMKKHVPLCAAAEEGHLDVVDLLLRKRANLNSKDGRGRTPLYIASQKGHRDIVVKLLDSGADPDEKNDIEACVPLHIASSNGFPDIVSCLIEDGSDVNATDRWKETPLHHACKDERTDVAKLLLEAGANKHLLNGDKRTPADLAKRKGCQELVDLIGNFVPVLGGVTRPRSVQFESAPTNQPSNSPGASVKRYAPPQYHELGKFPESLSSPSAYVKIPFTLESNKPDDVSEPPRLTRRSMASRSAFPEYSKSYEVSETSFPSRTSSKRTFSPEFNRPDEAYDPASFSFGKRLRMSLNFTSESKASPSFEFSDSSSANASRSTNDTEKFKDLNYQIAYLTYEISELEYDLSMLNIDKTRVAATNQSYKKILDSVRELCDLTADAQGENSKWTFKKRELTCKLKDDIDKEASVHDQIKVKETDLKKLKSRRDVLNEILEN